MRCEARSCSAIARGQPIESAVRLPTFERERLGSFRAGTADARRRLLDQRRDGGGLRVDTGANLLERDRSAVDESRRRSSRGRSSASSTVLRRSRARRFDLAPGASSSRLDGLRD